MSSFAGLVWDIDEEELKKPGQEVVKAAGGTAGEVSEWDQGAHLDCSSTVQAVCDWYGPSNLLKLSAHPSDVDHDAPDSSSARLVGGPLQENIDSATRASPKNDHVRPSDGDLVY